MVTRARQIKVGHSPDTTVRWMGPLPVWAHPGPAGLRLHDKDRAGQPAILRFDHDAFMQEFIDTLAHEPARLGEWIAQPETWREPMRSPTPAQAEAQPVSKIAFVYDQTRRLTAARKPALPTAINLQTVKSRFRRKPLSSVAADCEESLPLKLYQAGQKRHYLISASLISEEPGLPDWEPELARREKVSFVVRRLLPPQIIEPVSQDATETGPQEGNEKAPQCEWDEYAYVPGPRSNSWCRIGRHDSAPVRGLVTGEEQLPMFPVVFRNGCDEGRRLFSGTIPVSRREQWIGAEIGVDASADGSAGNAADDTGRSLASLLFQTDVVAPWKLLLEQAEFKRVSADKTFRNFDSDAAAQARERKRLFRTTRDEIQTGSWYVLLDFARFLRDNLPDVWQVLKGEEAVDILDDAEQDLLSTLRNTVLSSKLAWEMITGKTLTGNTELDNVTDAEQKLQTLLDFIAFSHRIPDSGSEAYAEKLAARGYGTDIPTATARYRYVHLRWTLADALVATGVAGATAAADQQQGLEAVESTFVRFDEHGGVLDEVDDNWPDFLFPLADPQRGAPMPAVGASELTGLTGLARRQKAVDVLAEMVERLLPSGEPAGALIDTVPPGDPRTAWFVVRCVYERPTCGPLFPPLVSAPTQKFQMAPFFDPDAPARPVRIPMPLDISPAGLRKYQKNTAFVMSDMLCGKLKRIRKLTFADLVLSVLPWPFHKDLPDPGKGGQCGEGDNSFGMICSLSIPIVTLCAFILLMVIVALFDLFFRWIPYLFVCLPIPGLKGKS